MTETWISNNDSDIFASILDFGYTLYLAPRQTGRGGGVGFMIRNDFYLSPSISFPPFSYSDCISLTLKLPNLTLHLTVIYRPPKPETSLFFDEFHDFIHKLPSSSSYLPIVLGDLNYHYNSPIYPHGDFKLLTESLSLCQHISFPTHSSGNTLDIIFTPLSSPLIRCINPNSFQKIELLTDHFIIEFSINLKFTNIKRKRITYRDVKSIDLPRFVNNIKTEISSSTSLCPVLLNSILLNIINIHAPTKTTLITDRPFSPWFSHELFIFKKSVRKFEKKFLKNPSTETKLALSLARKNYKSTISRSKSIYYNKKIALISSNPRKLFKIANKILSPPDEKILPILPNTSNFQLCSLFEKFFKHKIASINNIICASTQPILNPTIYITHHIDSLSTFTIPSLYEVNDLLMKSHCTSPTDPLPLSLYHKLSPLFSPIFLNIIANSLNSGQVSPCLKTAIISPILKKQNLDPNSFSNYRPISHLPLLSKILERIVSKQLIAHVNKNNLFDPFQSDFRKGHSTETALLRITDTILSTLNSNTCCQLILLDLSSAFDTLDHNILISRLTLMGISGLALKWFTSYLTIRNMSIMIDKSYSPLSPLNHGIPQGSVLGPSLFSIYIRPIADLIKKFPNIHYHIFADDIQLFTFFPINSHNTINSELIECANSIRLWLLSNKLLINSSKTTVLNISTSETSFPNFTLNNMIISPSHSSKNLGLVFDDKLSLENHISSITKSSNFHLFRIKKIRTSLSRNLTKTLINALVLSRNDYCSSLLNLLPAKATAPLNRIIRSSIRTTYCLTRLDHSTTTSHQSSRMWLPFSLRCKLRILSIIHKSIYSFTPSYISDLIKKRTILSSLRYQNAPLLISQNSSKTSLNSRAFKNSGPTLWNSLPPTIRSIRSHKRFINLTSSFLSTHNH